MITRLALTNFKNFQRAELSLGPLTVLVGANATGKSNLRDAFRFLHGISRGYGLADIFGDKYVESGVLQWKGIRGGTREATYNHAKSFTLEVDLDFTELLQKGQYRIEVEVGENGKSPGVVSERLILLPGGEVVFESHQKGDPINQTNLRKMQLKVMNKGRIQTDSGIDALNIAPVISQLNNFGKLKNSLQVKSVGGSNKIV